jgi:hypothetical protein
MRLAIATQNKSPAEINPRGFCLKHSSDEALREYLFCQSLCVSALSDLMIPDISLELVTRITTVIYLGVFDSNGPEKSGPLLFSTTQPAGLLF